MKTFDTVICLEDNQVANLLVLPFEFQEIYIEIEYNVSRGYSATRFNPEEYPELEINYTKVTGVNYFKDGNFVDLTLSTKQKETLQNYVESKFESYITEICWDNNNESIISDLADEAEYLYESKHDFVPFY